MPLTQESLGGNAKTVMIANVSPAMTNMADTLSTLRFAQRVKAIRNTVSSSEETAGGAMASSWRLSMNNMTTKQCRKDFNCPLQVYRNEDTRGDAAQLRHELRRLKAELHMWQQAAASGDAASPQGGYGRLRSPASTPGGPAHLQSPQPAGPAPWQARPTSAC